MPDDNLKQPQLLQIVPVEFLRPGYILASRHSGELYLYQIAPVCQPNIHAETVFNAIVDLLRKPDTLRIFLSREDSAIATEFYPDFLQDRQREDNPPAE